MRKPPPREFQFRKQDQPQWGGLILTAVPCVFGVVITLVYLAWPMVHAVVCH